MGQEWECIECASSFVSYITSKSTLLTLGMRDFSCAKQFSLISTKLFALQFLPPRFNIKHIGERLSSRRLSPLQMIME